jgi:hypothetical protein
MVGPLGRPGGTIIAHESVDPALVKLDTAFQQWKPFPGGDDQPCIGLTEGQKPTPEQLQRPSMLRGHWVTLADGSRWLVPVARGFDAASERMYMALPMQLELDCSTGRWIAGGVEAQHKAFFDLAESHAQKRWEMLQRGELQFVDDNADALAIAALQTNYRVGNYELSFFPGAYTPQSRQQILDAVLDVPTWVEWSNKKKDRDSVGIST